jgi:hypothetical protein
MNFFSWSDLVSADVDAACHLGRKQVFDEFLAVFHSRAGSGKTGKISSSGLCER